MESQNYDQYEDGWKLFPNGSAEFTDLFVTGFIKTVSIDGNIQEAIDIVGSHGGGEVHLDAGTFELTEGLNIPSNVALVGQGIGVTILNLSAETAIQAHGTNVYSIGTITSVVGGTAVTGSGTSWLANVVAGYQIWLNNRWHIIAAVTGNTTLVLAEAYTGPPISAGTAYVTANVVSNVKFQGFTVQQSSQDTSIVDFSYCRGASIKEVLGYGGDVNFLLFYVSVGYLSQVISASSSAYGFKFLNCGLFTVNDCPALSSLNTGFYISNMNVCDFDSCISEGNTIDGVYIDNSTNTFLNISSSQNNGMGYKLNSANENIIIFGSSIFNNATDGIRLVATSDNCRISNNLIQSNGSVGIVIAAASCNDNIIIGNIITINTAGIVTDSGTNTLIRSNIPTSIDNYTATSNPGSGTYTPTLTNLTNLSASTTYVAQYMRVGNTVNVSGKVDIDPTLTATKTVLKMSLPINSTFATSQQCAGVAFSSDIAAQGAAIVAGKTTSRMEWVSADISNQPMFYNYTYQII